MCTAPHLFCRYAHHGIGIFHVNRWDPGRAICCMHSARYVLHFLTRNVGNKSSSFLICPLTKRRSGTVESKCFLIRNKKAPKCLWWLSDCIESPLFAKPHTYAKNTLSSPRCLLVITWYCFTTISSIPRTKSCTVPTLFPQVNQHFSDLNAN